MERRHIPPTNNWNPPNTYHSYQNYQPVHPNFHQFQNNHGISQNMPHPSYKQGINPTMYKSNIQPYANPTPSYNQTKINMVKYPLNNFQNIEPQKTLFQGSYNQPRVKNQLYSSQIFGFQTKQPMVSKEIEKNTQSIRKLQENPINAKNQFTKGNQNKKRQQLEAIRRQLEEVSKKLSVHKSQKIDQSQAIQIPKKNYGIAQSMISTSNQSQDHTFYSKIQPKKKAFGNANAQVNKFLSCLSAQQPPLEATEKHFSNANLLEKQKKVQNSSQMLYNINLGSQGKQKSSNITETVTNYNFNLNNDKQEKLSSLQTTTVNLQKKTAINMANLEVNQQAKQNKMFKKKENPLIQSFSYVQLGEKARKSLTSNTQNPTKFKKSDFLLGKKMGKGQFGQVFLVRHKLTGFICGMKIMQKKQIKSEKYVAQISRQLSIQFYLSHRNIAPLYGFFQDDEYVYLLLEFCPEGQLYDKMKKQRRLSEQETSQIIRQACQGIDYIHKELIIHRDIKPENILFSFGQIKICDFGWAVYRGQGMRKTASGSPLYYSPEIVLGNQYDEKIDIWDIGMMAYECILGKVPFRIYSQLDLNRIVTDDIKFPEYIDVTDQAKDFILKTMRKDPQQRMQIREMLKHPFLVKHKPIKPSMEMMEDFTKVLNQKYN